VIGEVRAWSCGLWNTGSIPAQPHEHIPSPVAADTPVAHAPPLPCSPNNWSDPLLPPPAPGTTLLRHASAFYGAARTGHWGSGRSGSRGRLPLAFLCVTARSRPPPPPLLVLRCGAQPEERRRRVLCSCATTATTPAARPAASSRCGRVR
jgi:hypothetical protein